MSGWDAYIDVLVKSGCTGAAIYGLNPGGAPALWASYASNQIAADEAKVLHDALSNSSSFSALFGTGFKWGGTKFMAVASEDGIVVRGKAGDQAAVACKTGKAIVFGVGNGSPQIISKGVESLANDLKGKGF